ncbi:MAG TPA: PilZ domain-containing protein [Candidatus Sulfotelmatobacter sp.]|nr:PilZ domain-containing protein [Candidatus Sulfotelmatobacter sp.]
MASVTILKITAVTFLHAGGARILKVMRKSAAVLCHDTRSLQTLSAVLDQLGIELHACRSNREALELALAGECSTLIVDFDLPGAEEAIRMASLLPPAQKPNLLAVASRAWPGTGQAFQSGASRILYRPLQPELVKDALKAGEKKHANRRKSARYEMKTLVYLEIDKTTVSAVSIDIGEHGLAIQASEPVPIHANVPFRCELPGTHITLHGYADVIWASDQGRAGLFFSKLAPAARKHLKQWLSKRGSHTKHAVRDLMPPDNDHVEFAATSDEVLTEAQ